MAKRQFSPNAEYRDTGDGEFDLYYYPPESTLYEPQYFNSDNLSPDIVPKLSRINRVSTEVRENDNIEIEDVTIARKTERSILSSLKHSATLNVPTCDSKLNIKFMNDLLDLENDCNCEQLLTKLIVEDSLDATDYYSSKPSSLNDELNKSTADVADSERSWATALGRKISESTPAYELPHSSISSQLATLCLGLEPQSNDNVRTVEADEALEGKDRNDHNDCNGGEKREKRFSPETMKLNRQVDDNYKDEATDDCYSLDRTLPINDDLLHEMNGYLDEESSTTIADHSTTIKTISPIAATRELQTNLPQVVDDVRSLRNKSGLFSASVCRLDKHDEQRDISNEKEQRPSHEKSFDVMAEKIGKRLLTNWREFRQMFAHLRWIDRKIFSGEDITRGTSKLSKYERFYDNPRFRCANMPISSSLASPLSSRANNAAASCKRCSVTAGSDDTRGSSFARETYELDESPRSVRPSRKSNIRQESVATPYKVSSPSAKRCRTILKFEDENEEVKKEQAFLATRAEIADPILAVRKRGSREEQVPLDSLPCDDIHHWDSCASSESTPFCFDLITVPDYDGCSNSLRKAKYQDDTYKCYMPRSTTIGDCQEQDLSPRKSAVRVGIKRLTALCVWLVEKLLHLLNSGYRKLRRVIVSSLSEKISVQSPQMREFNCLITKLRVENEKILHTLSEKVMHLSTDFVQIRASTEATLDNLTVEVNNVREASRKINETNMMLMQELKKLHETMKEVRLKSAEPIASDSSRPLPYPPPPAPPPPPLTPRTPPPPTQSPALQFSPKARMMLKATSSVQQPPPPPPPPLPPPFPSTPLTSNSSKNNKSKVTLARKFSTPLSNRPSITVEDLLKVTLKKAPLNMKDNRRNTTPCSKGPVVSLDMIRNVKLKSARRRINDQTRKSPRNGRIIKSRTSSNLNHSPIMNRSEDNLERILQQVELNRHGPRRLSSSNSFRDHDLAKNEAQSQLLEALKRSQSQSTII